MRRGWLILALISSSAFAFNVSGWVGSLEVTRADLLTEARVNVSSTEPAEDTELEFSLACAELSNAERTLHLTYFKYEGDTFQVGVGVDTDGDTLNGFAVHSAFTYDRSEIEK